MVALDELDSKVRSQLVGGVDILASAEMVRRETRAIKEADGFEGSDDTMKLRRMSSNSFSDQITSLVSSLNDKKSIERLLLSTHNPGRDVDYYVLLKLILLSLEDQELAPLFDRWVSIDDLPSFTNILAWNCIDQICAGLASGILESSTITEFDGKINHLIPVTSESNNGLFRSLLRYIIGFKTFQSNHAELVNLGKQFTKFCLSSLENVNFPRATRHSHWVDLIATTCIYLFQDFGAFFKGYDICQKSLLVSYQSIPVMKLWCLSAISSGKKAEVVPAFKTYLAYVNDTTIKNFNVRRDPVNTINSYLLVLSYVTRTWNSPKRELFVRVCDWIGELKDVIDYFLNLTSDSTELYTDPLQRYLSSVWFELGFIHERLCLVYTATEEVLNDRIESTYDYYKKAVELTNLIDDKDSSFAVRYFRYALILAKRLEYSDAIKNVKKALKLEPDALEYLNVIVLLYSAVDENVDKPLAITKEVLETIGHQFSGERSEIPLQRRVGILQMYMTYIALVEASTDCYEALDCLQELFDMAHKLLGVSATKATNASITSTDSQVQLYSPKSGVNGNPARSNLVRVVSSHRPSIRDPDAVAEEVKRAETRHRVFGLIRTKKIDVRKIKVGRTQKEKPVERVEPASSVSTEERKVMHDLWLWASKLFEKCGQVSDAEGCIKEAEAVYKVTSDSYARMGQILAYSNPKLALQQLEIALEMSEDSSVEAILGFAKLILSEEGKKVFIGQQDKMAAIGRCKNYLRVLTACYGSCTMSEVYYYLSEIYALYNDKPMEVKNLWRTVGLEERRPVRELAI
ncbi:DEKNAAC103122 [Brettanomyces naardenensis]|uniref:Cargo-transport protein YPP1 n=1 Tax=Brettanomyces naardenensis TaxID=13370 RepID=A0A448YMK0_BRENA|nr:DEKNAAC103122 [Brettanomyces naardenensis]